MCATVVAFMFDTYEVPSMCKFALTLGVAIATPLLFLESAQAVNLVRYDFTFRVPVGFRAASGEVGTGYVVYDADLITGRSGSSDLFYGRSDTPEGSYIQIKRYPSPFLATDFQLDFLGRRFGVNDGSLTPSITTDENGAFCGVNFAVNRPQLGFDLLGNCQAEKGDRNYLNRSGLLDVDFYRGDNFYIRGRSNYPFDASNVINYTLTLTPEPSPISTPEPSPISTPEPSPISTPEPSPIFTPEPSPISTPESSVQVSEPRAIAALVAVALRFALWKTQFFCKKGAESPGRVF
jgi:hypothetical protein